MKKTILLLLMVLATTISRAQYKPIEQGSTLKFTVKNLGFDVDGTFSGFEGSINFDPQNLAGSNFDVTVTSATVNTGNDMRDGHLKDDDYFDVGHYPRIRLQATKITAIKNGVYQFSGQLFIKDKVKTIVFPFSATPAAKGYIFKGSFKMNRKDFGIGGTSTIANELEVMINVVAQKA